MCSTGQTSVNISMKKKKHYSSSFIIAFLKYLFLLCLRSDHFILWISGVSGRAEVATGLPPIGSCFALHILEVEKSVTLSCTLLSDLFTLPVRLLEDLKG